jgi:two-component system chemotaxis sensor kinase CheA
MFENLLQEAKEMFREDAVDLFAELDAALLALEAEPGDAEAINRVFRAMHTIKGSGGTAGFDHMSRFAHHVEDVFNQARDGRATINSEVVDAALKACDLLKQMLLEPAGDEAARLDAEAHAVAESLARAAGATGAANAAGAETPVVPTLKLSFVIRPKPGVGSASDGSPSCLDELRQLGQVEFKLKPVQGPDMPDGAGWDVELTTAKPEPQVRNVLEGLADEYDIELSTVPAAAPAAALLGGRVTDAFNIVARECVAAIDASLAKLAAGDTSLEVRKSCQLSLRTLESAAKAANRGDLADHVDGQLRLAGFLVGGQPSDLAWSVAALEAEQVELRALLDPPESKAEVRPPGTQAAVAPIHPERAADPGGAEAGRTIRVDQVKLDRLMRAIGELLVARGPFPTIAARLVRDHGLGQIAKEVRDAGTNVSRIADDLQSIVMSMRMLPVRSVLQRFPRLVRDVSRQLKKNIDFVTEGDQTELDKTVIERISDPLVHLVRNAADHGIEMPDERAKLGKPAAGTVRVSASNQGHSVVLVIKDDGRGLDPDRLKRKAVSRGMITQVAADAMDAAAARDLIFAPGFSTSEQVTDISGRGVGMDVVRRNILALQGTVEIESVVGTGTTFTIRLPTSLVVSKGILFEVGNEEYIIPVQNLLDMVKLPRSALHSATGRSFAHVRNEVYPLISTRDLMASDTPGTAGLASGSDEVSIAIVKAGELRYGIIVDRFVSQEEVIVKPLTGDLGGVQMFSGATIMGDGRVVLVINPSRLADAA